MGKKEKFYSREEKLHLIQLYHESGVSKYSFCKSHGIYSSSVFNRWLKKFALEGNMLLLPSDETETDMANRSKDAYKDENAQLKKRIKELEKALTFSKLETQARDLMITRAEDYFKIPIRKKSGAK